MRGGFDRPRVILLLLLIITLMVLASVWGITSLDEIWRPGRLQELTGRFVDSPWLPWMVMAGVVIAQQIAIPQVLLVAASVVVLGPWQGGIVVYFGSLVGAVIGYVTGRYLARHPVRRMSGRRVKQLSRLLAKRGVVNMIIINLFAILPQTVINLVAGTSHLTFRDFIAGTAIGIVLPTIVVAVATQFLIERARVPTTGEAFLAVLVVGLIAVGFWLATRWVWNWLERQ